MTKLLYEKKDLTKLVDSINKDFGSGSVMLLSKANIDVERVPTGSLTLDIALGGGWPRGRIVEIFGAESSSKTTAVLHAIAEVQKLGGTAGFIDAEHSLDPAYAKAIGVNVDEMLISQCDNGEMGLDVCNRFVASGLVDIVVVDSVAALVPKAEIEGESGDAHVGLQARLMGQAMRKLTAIISKSNCIVIFTNQERDLIGGYGGYGPKTTTPGGKALKFFASIRLDVTRIQTLKKGNEEYGIRVKAKAVKNKVSAPYRVAEYDVIFGQGISAMGCIVDLAEELSIITKRGAWYSYEGTNVGQGKENTIQWLREHPEKAAEIEEMIKMLMAPAKDEDVVVEEELA